MKRKFTHYLGPIFGFLLFALSIWSLHYALREYRYHDVMHQFAEIPPAVLCLALALTVVNYFALIGYDVLGFRYIRHPLKYRKIAIASFIGHAFSNNIGHPLLSGGSVRYRLYSVWGLSTEEVSKVVAFCTLTFGVGFFTVSGVLFVFDPAMISGRLHLLSMTIRLIGILLLGIVGGYLFWSASKKAPFKIWGWEFPFPSLGLSLSQILLSSFDWVLSGSVFYVLLPHSSSLSFPTLLGVFLVAQIAGLISHVPAGLGVFETVTVTLLSSSLPASSVVIALLAYRGIYYFLPLLMATVLLGIYEIRLKKKEFRLS